MTWPVAVHIAFHFRGKKWTRHFEVLAGTRVLEMKKKILEGGTLSDVQSMQLIKHGERVPDFTLILQEVTMDFALFRPEEGALLAEEDLEKAKELGQVGEVDPEKIPCSECGATPAIHVGDGEFAGQIYCSGCWAAWGLEAPEATYYPEGEAEAAAELDVVPEMKGEEEADGAEADTEADGKTTAAAKPKAAKAAAAAAGGSAAPKQAGAAAAQQAKAAEAEAAAAAAEEEAARIARAQARQAVLSKSTKDLAITVVLDRDLDISTQVAVKAGSTLKELKASMAALGDLPEEFGLGLPESGARLPDSTVLSDQHLELELVD